jgi:hypothetical protein
MAGGMNLWKKFRGSMAGKVLEVLLYALMLILICIYAADSGTFLL